jgi:signal transduction histidine kinase
MIGRAPATGQGLSTGAKAAAREQSLFDRLLHDLRNPVGVMAYYAETIPGVSPAERDEMFERLRVNAQRALHVLDEFSLLAELRAGRCRIEPEPCDLAALVAELAAELEALERRPGCIRSQVEVAAPIAVARLHVLCALRALLRVALRVTATEDAVDLTVHRDGAQLLFEITACLRNDPALGVVIRVPSTGIEIELAERIAALYAGHYAVDQEPGRAVMLLALSLRS